MNPIENFMRVSCPCYVNPSDILFFSEPGELPLGISFGGLLDKGYGVGQGYFAAEMEGDFLVSYRLHGRQAEISMIRALRYNIYFVLLPELCIVHLSVFRYQAHHCLNFFDQTC